MFKISFAGAPRSQLKELRTNAPSLRSIRRIATGVWLFILNKNLKLEQNQIMETTADDELNQIMQNVGYISIYMNTYEMLLAMLYQPLLSFEYSEFEALLLGEKTLQQKMQLVTKLLGIIPFEANLKKEALDHIDWMHKLREQRNSYVHGIVHTITEEDGDRPGYYIKKVKDWSKSLVNKLTVSEIQKVKGDIFAGIQKQEQINLKLLEDYIRVQDELIAKKKKLSEILNFNDPNAPT